MVALLLTQSSRGPAQQPGPLTELENTMLDWVLIAWYPTTATAAVVALIRLRKEWNR